MTGITASPPRVCIIFLIIQWLGVNYSAYTMVATDIFQGIHLFFILQSLL